MKTLIYTSIYSNLWGTRFGGRASRDMHYKISLLNILNLSADKFICFTSYEELQALKDYFYIDNNVSSDILEFKVFNLHETKNFEKISKNKSSLDMKTFDRCFEIQYNKFHWLDKIEDIHLYDKIFWIDAGLSHNGLFPDKYATGIGYNRYFTFSLINKLFLEKMISTTKDSLLLIGKSNYGDFYWSNTLPEKYYDNYQKDIHIVGGLFGGNRSDMMNLKQEFEGLLTTLLLENSENFMEEQIMSCLYYNKKDLFKVWSFDKWYPNEGDSSTIKYFYNIFE